MLTREDIALDETTALSLAMRHTRIAARARAFPQADLPLHPHGRPIPKEAVRSALDEGRGGLMHAECARITLTAACVGAAGGTAM